MRRALLPLGLALAGLACNAEIPTGPQPSAVEPSLAAAGNSGCYTVAGTISETGVFPTFTGTLAGDLVGTTSTTLRFDVRPTGAVIHNPGGRTLTITGGSVPELVGVTVQEAFDGLTVFEPHSPIRLTERTRVVAGAQRGNLTTHGTLDLAPFPWEVELEYQGVICP